MYEAFPKLIELDELSPEHEPTIQIVRAGEYNQLGHVKTASEALDYIKSVKPIPGKTIILVLAMTAGEFYSANRNGDAWNERDVRVGPTLIPAADGLRNTYKTFETNANVFKHHINKDPEKRIGEVLKAFYNDDMHRVELLLALDHSRAEDIVERIERGEFPAVSMGTKVPFDVCFIAGTLVETSEGIVPIENVDKNTIVVTHTGRHALASSIVQRSYSGCMVRLKVKGVHESTSCTAKHPYSIIRAKDLYQCTYRKKARCTPAPGTNTCLRCGRELPRPEWIAAEEIEVGDYAVYPKYANNSEVGSFSTDRAYVLGRFAGDGHLAYGCRRKDKTRDLAGVHVAIEDDQDLLDAYTEALKRISPSGVHVYQIKDERAFNVYTTNRKLANEASTLIGHYSATKSIGEAVFAWSDDAKMAFIGGYLDSDGYVDARNGMGAFSTISASLAYKLRSLFASINIPATVCVKEQVGGFAGAKHRATVSIGRSSTAKLIDFSVKARKYAHQNTRQYAHTFVTDKHLCAAITSIEYWDATNIDVYNMSVQGDESYIAGGVSVHNCSICGNKAPSRKQYCDHAKYHLGEYIPSTGKRVFVWNPKSRFFDISMVRRPADKHGFMMKKVAEAVPEIRSSAIMGEYIENASRKIANLNKMSIINKVLRGEAVATKDDDGTTNVLKDFGNRIAKPVASSMQPLTDNTIQEMLKYHPAEVLSTLSSMGILLTTPEFIKYFVWKVAPGVVIPEEALDRAVACQQSVFKMLANNPQLLDDITDTGFIETSDKHINDDLAQKAASLLEKRSQAKDYLYRHLVPDIFKEDVRHQGNWDVVNVRDPQTGRKYQTTRMAARQAGDEAGKRQLQNLLGGGAMLAGAAGLTMLPMASLAGGALGYAGAKRFSKGYQGYPSARAETGERIYGRPTQNWSDREYAGTELIEKRSSQSTGTDTHTMIRIAMDLAHRPGAQNERVNMQWLETAENLSFEEAATKLGEIICP